MPPVSILEALCSSCINDRYCIYPRDPLRPIMECEEFEGYFRPQAEVGLSSAPVSNRERATGGEDANVFKGLCVSCGNRRTCIYKKPEGGVWHCEECE